MRETKNRQQRVLPSVRAITIALVDDDPSVHTALNHGLEAAHDLQLIGNFLSGADAAKQLPKLRPDVVLMDISMPRMSGIECTRILTATAIHPAVVMYTAQVDRRTILRSLIGKAVGYVTKSTISCCQLAEAIREAHGGGSPLCPEARMALVQSFNGLHFRSRGTEVFSGREQDILGYLFDRLGDKEISSALGIAECTVRTHLRAINKKLAVHTRAQAVTKYFGMS